MAPTPASHPHGRRAPLLLIPLLFSGPALAWDPGLEVAITHSPTFNYREPGLMEQDGHLTGLAAHWTLALQNDAFLRFSGALGAGRTDYDGATMDSGTAATSEADDAVLEVGARIGARFSDELPLSGYAGIGWRYWDQDLQDGITEDGDPVAGYERYHQYLYLPLGLRFAPAPTGGGLRWAFQAELRPLLWGEAGADIPSLGSFRLSMDQGTGYALSARLEQALDHIHLEALFAELAWTYWDIERSEFAPTGGGQFVFEPANRTTEVSISLGVRF